MAERDREDFCYAYDWPEDVLERRSEALVKDNYFKPDTTDKEMDINVKTAAKINTTPNLSFLHPGCSLFMCLTQESSQSDT